jgi:hypothetical protein
VGDSGIKRVRHHRKRKHRYRRFAFILAGAVLVIGLFYMRLFSMRSKSGAAAAPNTPAVSDDSTGVQFK